MQYIQATRENSQVGDYLSRSYTNRNGQHQGPFYFKITGHNNNSWKVQSVDQFGNNRALPYRITQIKRNGEEYESNITSINNSERSGSISYISYIYTPHPF